MKFLTTLNSEPHPNFIDIPDSTIYSILRDDFGLHIQDISSIKDIINTYSYMLTGDKGYYNGRELELPYGMDIVNSAIAIYIKSNPVSSVNNYLGIDDNIKTVELQHNIDTLLSTKLTGRSIKKVVRKLKSVDDIIRLPIDEFVSPAFDTKLKNEEFYLSYDEEKRVKVGYLYIDFSASMVKYRKFMKILRDNLVFNKIKIYIRVIIKSTIVDYGVVESKKDFNNLLSKIANKYIAGKINVSMVLLHSNSHKHLSTFITDAEDFDVDIFIKKTKNFNLLKIDKDGKINKLST